MKNLFTLLVTICLVANTVFAQSTVLSSEKLTVTRSDKTMNTDTSNNPYMAVTIMFRNQGLLQDKNFVGKFKRVEAFIARASITYKTESVEIPLFLLQRDKKSFSTATFKEATIVKKLPVSTDSRENPTATVIAEGTIKKQDIALLQKITKSIAPIVANPTSIMGGPQIATTLFGFFDDAVTNLSSTTKVTTSMKFNLFGLDTNNIEPNGYSIVFLKPANEQIGTGFELKPNGNNELTLYQGGNEFKSYPYFIVEVGVSKYLQIEGTPSDFYSKKLSCDITANEINQLRIDLDKVKGGLSNNQLAAERNLMNIYNIHFAIANGVRLGAADDNIATIAYNNLSDYMSSKPSLTNFPDSLREKYYKNAYDTLTGCIDGNVSRLAFYQELKNVVPLLTKDRNTFTNEDIGILRSYIDKTTKFLYLKNLQFNLNVFLTLNDVEKQVYDTEFAPLIRSINDITVADDGLIQKEKALKELREEYINCSKCIEEAAKAQNYINSLKDDKETRETISGLVKKSEETQSLANIALGNLDFAYKQSPNPGLPILRQNLDNNIKELIATKGRLADKLSIKSYSTTDKNEIKTLLSQIKMLIIDTEANIERVNRFIRNNEPALSSPASGL